MHVSSKAVTGLNAGVPDQLGRGLSREPADMVVGTRVHRDAYTDPDVFQLEMQRIFLSTWIYVGHDSEIPNVGDFKRTWVGTEPVVLARDKDTRARVLVNRCSHRGAEICQVPKGTTTTFRCKYHGWTFGVDGSLQGMPFPEGYEGADRLAMNLSQAPLVDSYRGFIFASFNGNAGSLVEHLGQVVSYIDHFIDFFGETEIRVSPDANESLYEANWKMQLENNADGYHLNFTHQSVFKVVQHRTGRSARYLGPASAGVATTESFKNGHAVMDLRAVAPERLRERLGMLPGAPKADADLDDFFGSPRSAELYLKTTGPPMNVAIFPNLNLGSINICEIHPISVERTRVVLRPILLASAPDAINRQRLRYHELGSGPAGYVQPDDLEMFERISKGMAADAVEWVDLNRGRARAVDLGNGHVRGDVTDEVPQRAQYQRWRELMVSD